MYLPYHDSTTQMIRSSLTRCLHILLFPLLTSIPVQLILLLLWHSSIPFFVLPSLTVLRILSVGHMTSWDSWYNRVIILVSHNVCTLLNRIYYPKNICLAYMSSIYVYHLLFKEYMSSIMSNPKTTRDEIIGQTWTIC
jgi:hypothetical protein